MKLLLISALLVSFVCAGCNRKAPANPAPSETAATPAPSGEFKSANPFDPLAPQSVKATSNYNDPLSKGSHVPPPDVWSDVESDEDDLDR